jgi:hypothetical protein
MPPAAQASRLGPPPNASGAAACQATIASRAFLPGPKQKTKPSVTAFIPIQLFFNGNLIPTGIIFLYHLFTVSSLYIKQPESIFKEYFPN